MNEKSARKLQLSRRIDGIHPAAAWSIRVASIVFALIVGGLLLLALGYSPLKAYGTIIDGSLGSKTFVRQTIKIAIPLLGCALAIARASRCTSGTSAQRARSPQAPSARRSLR